MLKIGVVGAGIRGKFFAQGATINGSTQLVAFCDINQKIAQEAAEEFGVSFYTDYQLMFSKEKLDIVCITTPDFAHKDVVIAAAESKIAIYLEKPMATSLEDALIMKEAIVNNNVAFTVAYTNRWNPPYKRAKEIVEKGDVGEILSIYARLSNSITIPTEMLSWAGKSSCAWFLMSHPLDLALWYTGKKVKKVYATGYKKILTKMGIDTWDTIYALMTFEDDSTAMFESTWILPKGLPKPVDYKYQIVGSKGLLNLNMQDQMIHFTDNEKMNYPDTFSIDLHGHLFAHNLICFDSFVLAVKEGKDSLVTIEEAVENVKIIEAVHRSLVVGDPIYID